VAPANRRTGAWYDEGIEHGRCFIKLNRFLFISFDKQLCSKENSLAMPQRRKESHTFRLTIMRRMHLKEKNHVIDFTCSFS
jgi:hypothetical protein